MKSASIDCSIEAGLNADFRNQSKIEPLNADFRIIRNRRRPITTMDELKKSSHARTDAGIAPHERITIRFDP